jgi:P-type Cu+ transporter
MTDLKTVEIHVAGMDCADCTRHVQHAIANLPGVDSVDVFLGAEKAVVRLYARWVDMDAIRKAVEDAGYSVPAAGADAGTITETATFSRSTLGLLGSHCEASPAARAYCIDGRGWG